jgi:tetratricopeptide (TPR) repeat protein
MRGGLKILVLSLAGLAAPAGAASQWTESEIKAMPPFCAARLHQASSQVDYWAGVLGPDYTHAHHFCEGVGYLNRYYNATSTRDKRSNLQSAMGNLNYIASRASPTGSLLPEVYMYRGQVNSLMKQDAAAIADLQKAIEMNPGLTRAYSLAADLYLRLNQKGKALEVATDGVRNNPDSTTMQRLYVKAGGALPYPQPLPKPAPAPSIPPADTPAPANTASPVAPAEAAPSAEKPDPATPSGGETKPTGQPGIGSPSNPWCRFCPPEPEK